MTIKNFLLLIGFLLPTLSYAQSPQIQSPYSKFGLGDFLSSEVLAAQSMGGLSATYHDRSNLNPMNPASFAFLGGTSLDIGVNASRFKINSQTDEFKGWAGGMSNMNLGISLVNDYNRELEGRKSNWRFGTGIGLSPYTKVGYDVNTTKSKDGEDVRYQYKGSGGSYMINWGNGAKYKDFAFGVNFGFLLGKVEESQFNLFTDTILSYYHNRFRKDYSYRGNSIKLGAIWDYRIKSSKKESGYRGDVLTLGGYIQPSFDLKTTLNERIDRIYARDGRDGRVDSIFYADEVQHTSRHPMLYALGVSYGFEGQYRVGINYEGANWTDYSSGFNTDQMGGSNKISIGYEKSPDVKAYNSYWKKMAFRSGFFYGNDPRYVNGKQIRYYGITIGGGFPVVIPRQDIAFINLGLEIGKSGIPTDLDQTYFKFSISFSLTDKSWFFKQKYY